MNKSAAAYVYSVIACGGLMLAYSLAHWSSPDPLSWAVYLTLAMMASAVKLRLPGMEGTFSLGFLLLLYGVGHYNMPETLIAGCAAAAAGSIFNSKKRPGGVQLLFNTANLAFSAGLCYYVVHYWLPPAVVAYQPVAITVAACVYFVVNTLLVSGVLALLQGKPLRDVSREWYFWSFPYYLVGAALVGMIPSPGRGIPGEAWLILLPLIYLVHFFLTLIRWRSSGVPVGSGPNGPLPHAAFKLVAVVAFLGGVALILGGITWSCAQPVRFATYLTLAVIVSTWKIRMPGMRGTISPGFVLLLAGIATMSFGEVVFMAAVMGTVQVLWRAKRPPMTCQVLFSAANLAVSAGTAFGICQILAPWLSNSLPGELVIAALVLYGLSSLQLAAVLALVDGKPLGSVWQLCYFWSLPYYLVGAAIAGLMIAAWRSVDWPASLLVLPVMGLIYVSYGAHVQRAGTHATAV